MSSLVEYGGSNGRYYVIEPVAFTTSYFIYNQSVKVKLLYFDLVVIHIVNMGTVLF